MKTYNKPEILIENINVEDILSVSVADGAFDFNNQPGGSSITFDDLWGNN